MVDSISLLGHLFKNKVDFELEICSPPFSEDEVMLIYSIWLYTFHFTNYVIVVVITVLQ